MLTALLAQVNEAIHWLSMSTHEQLVIFYIHYGVVGNTPRQHCLYSIRGHFDVVWGYLTLRSQSLLHQWLQARVCSLRLRVWLVFPLCNTGRQNTVHYQNPIPDSFPRFQRNSWTVAMKIVGTHAVSPAASEYFHVADIWHIFKDSFTETVWPARIMQDKLCTWFKGITHSVHNPRT